MLDTTYRPNRNMQCHYWWDDPDRCWGQAELVDADYSGEGETTYMCQGHKPVYNGGDYDGEYLLPPTQENTKMNKWGSAMEIGTWDTEDMNSEEKIRYAYAQALKNLAWKHALFVLGFLAKIGLTWWLLARYGEAGLEEVKIAFAILLMSWWMVVIGLGSEKSE